jgi:hypothetical protein
VCKSTVISFLKSHRFAQCRQKHPKFKRIIPSERKCAFDQIRHSKIDRARVKGLLCPFPEKSHRMLDTIQFITTQYAAYAWGPWLLVLLLGGGFYFLVRSKFAPFFYLRHGVDLIRGKYDNPNDPGHISHFSALTAGMAGTIGMGNIAWGRFGNPNWWTGRNFLDVDDGDTGYRDQILYLFPSGHVSRLRRQGRASGRPHVRDSGSTAQALAFSRLTVCHCWLGRLLTRPAKQSADSNISGSGDDRTGLSSPK